MDNINTAVPQVSVIPDNDERRQIRQKYSRTALVLMLNIAVFNVIGRVLPLLICVIIGGGFGREAVAAGMQTLMDHDIIMMLLSVLPPILSESASILLGMRILGVDLKKLLSNRENYSGSTVAKLASLCLGLQLAASMIAALIQMILQAFGLTGVMPDLSATSSFGANIILIFYACLLGPVLEELLYRGILLQSMRKYNERFAIFLSALIFGLMHQNYQQFILGFLLGIPLAVVTVKYGSVIPSIFAHIFVNTFGMLSLYVLQYFAPTTYEAVQNGGDIGLTGINSSEFPVMIAIVVLRIGFFIAGGIIGIVSLVKGGNMTRPTPAGRSRALPILVSSLPWWIVFIFYIYLSFIEPFLV